jgi:hypothetical protein
MNHKVAYIYTYFKYLISQAMKSSIFDWILSKWYGVSIGKRVNQTLNIEYVYEGQAYSVYIPFERRLVPKMLNRTIELRYNNPLENKMINQQPGVPYFITPKHIGASSAVIISICEEKYITENQKIEI